MASKKLTVSKNDYLTMKDAARICNVTRQAIFAAVKKGKLPATRKGNTYLITLSDLMTYRVNRYDRALSVFKGKPLFDPKEGTYSLKAAADHLGVPYAYLHRNIMLKKLKSRRKGCAWIINEKDLAEFKEKHLNTKTTCA